MLQPFSLDCAYCRPYLHLRRFCRQILLQNNVTRIYDVTLKFRHTPQPQKVIAFQLRVLQQVYLLRIFLIFQYLYNHRKQYKHLHHHRDLHDQFLGNNFLTILAYRNASQNVHLACQFPSRKQL